MPAARLHQGGRIYGLIYSILCCVYSGLCLMRFSILDKYRGPPYLVALVIYTWIEWLHAAVAICGMVRKILLVRHHCGESRAVSYSMAVIAVVRKHPVIACIILPCTEESACSCAAVGAVRVSWDLCQTIAA